MATFMSCPNEVVLQIVELVSRKGEEPQELSSLMKISKRFLALVEPQLYCHIIFPRATWTVPPPYHLLLRTFRARPELATHVRSLRLTSWHFNHQCWDQRSAPSAVTDTPSFGEASLLCTTELSFLPKAVISGCCVVEAFAAMVLARCHDLVDLTVALCDMFDPEDNRAYKNLVYDVLNAPPGFQNLKQLKTAHRWIEGRPQETMLGPDYPVYERATVDAAGMWPSFDPPSIRDFQVTPWRPIRPIGLYDDPTAPLTSHLPMNLVSLRLSRDHLTVPLGDVLSATKNLRHFTWDEPVFKMKEGLKRPKDCTLYWALFNLSTTLESFRINVNAPHINSDGHHSSIYHVNILGSLQIFPKLVHVDIPYAVFASWEYDLMSIPKLVSLLPAQLKTLTVTDKINEAVSNGRFSDTSLERLPIYIQDLVHIASIEDKCNPGARTVPLESLTFEAYSAAQFKAQKSFGIPEACKAAGVAWNFVEIPDIQRNRFHDGDWYGPKSEHC